MKNTLFAYWPSVRTQLYMLALIALTMTLGVYIETQYPYLIREIVNIFTTNNTNAAESARNVFWSICAVVLVNAIVWRIFGYALSLFEARVMAHLDKRSFSILQRQDVRFFENSFTGSLVKQATRFRNSFEGLTDHFFYELGKNMLVILFIFVIFVRELPLLATVYGVWVIIFLAFVFLTAIWKFPLDEANASADSALSGGLADSIGNNATVKSYGMERAEQARFDELSDDSLKKRLRSWITAQHIMLVQAGLMTALELGTIWLMIGGWEDGTVTVGDFVFFQSYILWLFNQLWNMGNTIRRIFGLVADAKEMTEIYRRTPEIEDQDDASILQVTSGRVHYENIHFRYNTDSKAHRISGLDLNIAPGESVALVGPSGAGKTTLVKLLLRYFDVQQGHILIDGQDIKTVTQESLRQQIALVPQTPQLFHRSLWDNIAFANPAASKEEIIDAARRAHALEFIENLEDGFQTLVGERGVKLSGGEAQRVALARAFATNAPILVLDEATSALDSETEQLIQSAIAELLKGRTSIVIAHRLSTIMNVDRIIVLKNGIPVEMGNHSELIGRKGLYSKLWSRQSGGYLSEVSSS